MSHHHYNQWSILEWIDTWISTPQTRSYLAMDKYTKPWPLSLQYVGLWREGLHFHGKNMWASELVLHWYNNPCIVDTSPNASPPLMFQWPPPSDWMQICIFSKSWFDHTSYCLFSTYFEITEYYIEYISGFEGLEHLKSPPIAFLTAFWTANIWSSDWILSRCRREKNSLIVYSAVWDFSMGFLTVAYSKTALNAKSSRLLLETAVVRYDIFPFSSCIMRLWSSWRSWKWSVSMSYGWYKAERGTRSYWQLVDIERFSVSEMFEGHRLEGGVIVTAPYFSIFVCRH